MRYAILSDIHANATALQAVLTDAADIHAERIICLGDVLGYGPEPVEALELTYRKAHVCLAGNHDDAVAGRYPVEDFTEIAAAAVLRHRAALAQKAIDWLRHLPHTCEFSSVDGKTTEGAFACAHGDFFDPKHFNYILEPEDALPSWRARTEQLLFVGHTHKPGIFVLGGSGVPHALVPMNFTLEPGKRYLVNVGSVGYPRNGACRSFYCIYDDQSRSVYFRSLPFDLEGYRAKMNGQGVDEAPWIKVRAQERKSPEIRGSEKFGKPEKKFDKPEEKKETPLRPSRFALPFVIGAILLALGGVWCTVWLARALREGRADHAAVQSVDMASAAAPSSDEDTFADTLPLSSGWVASFEFPDCQSVRVDKNARTKETTFRMTSEKKGRIRFTKRISLFARHPKVYYTVKVRASSRSVRARFFGFEVCVTFRDAAGRRKGQNIETAMRSITNHAVKVPDDVEMAEIQIDCTCAGTYDLIVPVFKMEPIPSIRSVR